MNASPVNKKKCSKILSSLFSILLHKQYNTGLLNQKEKDMLVFQSQQPPNKPKNV